MQYQVPQFIDVEDKIAGPFTIRQFIYICAIAGIVFFLYFMIQMWLWLILTVIVASIGGAFAFGSVNGQRMSKVAEAAFMFYWKPQLYLWQPDHPQAAKTPDAINQATGGMFNLEGIISGMALRHTWQAVQTGLSASTPDGAQEKGGADHYQTFRRVTGELRAAKHVDYTG